MINNDCRNLYLINSISDILLCTERSSVNRNILITLKRFKYLYINKIYELDSQHVDDVSFCPSTQRWNRA